MKVLTNEEMKNLDKKAIEKYKIPGIILMENAGIAVAKEVFVSLKKQKNKRVAIFCGIGNNGGDGLVVARYLINQDVLTGIYIIGNPSYYKGDARINYEILMEIKASIYCLQGSEDLIGFKEILDTYSIIVDGIFGTGLKRSVDGIEKQVIDLINSSNKEIISIDIPSGINGNNGQIWGAAVKANKTITFQLPKVGNILFPGHSYCGKLLVEDIGIPKKLLEETEENISLITKDLVKGILGIRQPDTHKGSYGKALIIGGSFGMTGAIILASKAALRSGAGIVKAVVPKELNAIIEGQLVEGITLAMEEFADKSQQQLSIFQGEDVIAIGPGGGKSKGFKEFLHSIIENANVPIVIDADGLNILSEDINLLTKLKVPCILTPHPGEMSRLTGLSVEEINSNKIEVAKSFSTKWKVITLLKGAKTIISDERGKIYINDTGNPGMATAGSGDVLTGIITGLLAQNIDPLKATILGAYLHGKAGDRAAKRYGEYSLLAGDIINELCKVIKELVGR